MEENETINDHSSFVTEENISFISNVSPVVVSNDDTLTVSSQKISGKPKSIVWGRYIKQGREVSKGHWNATCNFCGVFWYKGSPATLENHLGNLCVKVPVEVRDFFLESYLAGDTLRTLAKENHVEGGGLKQWVNTHWHTMYDCVLSIINHKVTLEMILNDNPEILNTSVQTILHKRAFFDDLKALAFIFCPIKMAISTLESRNCSLADCFIGLVCLGAAIKKLPENDHHTFRQQAIAIFNNRFEKFDDDAYVLCFFLHPGYDDSVGAKGALRHILLTADNYYEKMGKNRKQRKELMSQMRMYRGRKPPFDMLFDTDESPFMWWFSLEDSFRKGEDHICQLANKLFSITPHAAGCERIWSRLGCRKPIEDLHDILCNTDFYDDENLEEVQIAEETHNIFTFPAEETLRIEGILNLDASDFTNNLDEEEEWDPEREIDDILDKEY
ncbi:5131_t:CDS:2 [Entrophospora sp. SA101]|nr:5131_t:CDS:2 [Entrophospora sp. SA101]